jgi:hypothetical protein
MTYEYAAVVLKPSKESFDFPTSSITAQGSTILRDSTYTITTMWSNHLNSGFRKSRVKTITVIRHVANDPLGEFREKAIADQRFDERHFMRRSTLDAYGDRKTSAVCNGHDLGPLATLGFPNTSAPFFAGANVPSTKHSRKSIPPRSRRSRASSSRTRLNTPDRTHCWNRRWHV